MLNGRKFALPLVSAGFVSAVLTSLLLSILIFITPSSSAQLPPLPSLHDDGTIISVTPTPPTNIPLPTVEITSPHDGQQVPVGGLTIKGMSSDDEESVCQVYADVNDITPMRNVTGIGPGVGVDDDFSRWIFTYKDDYQLITQGANELTAKISCFAAGNPIPLSEWHTINVTGVNEGKIVAIPAEEQGEQATDSDGDEGEELEEEEEEE